MKFVQSYRELEVFIRAMDLAMDIFEASKKFPGEEKYSLTDQIRRASRSVCANISEAWRKRRYKAAFISKLSDAETEAAEVQVWTTIALRLNSCSPLATAEKWDRECESLMAQIVAMMHKADSWLIRS